MTECIRRCSNSGHASIWQDSDGKKALPYLAESAVSAEKALIAHMDPIG